MSERSERKCQLTSKSIAAIRKRAYSDLQSASRFHQDICELDSSMDRIGMAADNYKNDAFDFYCKQETAFCQKYAGELQKIGKENEPEQMVTVSPCEACKGTGAVFHDVGGFRIGRISCDACEGSGKRTTTTRDSRGVFA